MAPLIGGFQLAPDAPVGVAQMVVEDRVVGHQPDRALEFAHRVLVALQPVIGPAERIHDVAVGGPEFDRALDEVEPLLEVHVHVDPGIAEIVQHLRVVGIELQRLLEVRLGALPFLQPLMGDAALVEDVPVLGLRFVDARHGALVEFGPGR
jgi:hypothetical protein